jgi:AcrR family transcriptional regulator
MALREENKIKTRARILKTARHMFRENGYEETMVSAIADKARVARQTLYNYFPSKGSLLVGIAEAEMAALEEMFVEPADTDAGKTADTDTGKTADTDAGKTADTDAGKTADTDTGATERIRRLLEAYILDAVSYLVMTRRIVFLINSLEEEPGRTQARIRSMLTRLVAQAKAEGDIRTDIGTDTAVDSLLGIYYSILYETPLAESRDKKTCKQRIGMMLDIVFDGLR